MATLSLLLLPEHNLTEHDEVLQVAQEASAKTLSELKSLRKVMLTMVPNDPRET